MISSRTLKLLFLGLALSLNAISASASFIVRPPAGVRARLLEDDNGNEDVPSPEEEPASQEPSQEENEEDEATASTENSPSADSGSSTRSAGIGPRARECTTQQGPDEVEFECKSVTENADSEIKDKLKFKVGATRGDYLKITVEYESEWETIETEAETETETQYTLVYDRLIEYRKVGDAEDKHYEWGIDEIVAEWPMDSWDELTAVETNGDLLTFSATVGVASFSFTIAQTDSADITTNKMKIDFLLENYPWDASGDTFVALVSHIETERKTETDMEEPGSDRVSDVLISFQDAVDTIGFIPFGEYTWATTAEATFSVLDTDDTNATDVMVARSGNFSSSETTTISVVASTSPSTESATGDSTFQEIAFSFVGAGQGADRIFWDPEAGVGYASSAARVFGSLVLLAMSTGLTVLL